MGQLPRKLPDLSGQRFGKLTVIGRATLPKGSICKWLCRCECGKTKAVQTYSLRRGETRSCGCSKIHRREEPARPPPEGSRYVLLSAGKVALVDSADYERVAQFIWSASKPGGCRTYYASRSFWKNGKKEVVFLHRFIMNAGPSVEVDHADHDGLNNRRLNLRLCTKQMNMRNVSPSKGNKGAVFIPSRGKWRANIVSRPNADGSKMLSRHLGYFDTAEQAHAAYDAAAKQYFGEFAFTNEMILTKAAQAAADTE